MRCDYRHETFTESSSRLFNPFNLKNHTHDGTGQCWVAGNDVTEFSSPNKETRNYCLFHAHHAPEGWTQNKWDTSTLGEKQSTRLEELLDQWNSENKSRKSNSETLFAFALPGMQCGSVKFTNYTFSHDIYFRNAKFNGNANFYNATFSDFASFGEATFRDWADFALSTFNGATSFDHARFSGFTSFNNTTFRGAVSFNHINCSEQVIFNMNLFCGDVSFKESKFNRPLKFHLAKMEKGGRFVNCQFHSLTYQTHIGERLLFNHCSTNEKLDFIDQDCSRLAFLNMDLTKAYFLGADVSKTRFDACQWKVKGGPKYATVYKHDEYLKPPGESLDEGTKEENEEDYKDRVSKLKALYRQLMKNLEENREYKQAGDFHYREMELRQKMLKDGLADPESWFERPMLWLYRVVGDFGENYVKLGGWLIASWLSSACLIWAFNLDRTYLHILGIVVTAIIPGWPKPQTVADFNPFCKTVLVVEVVIAVILTTLFAMAVNRRFRR